jgi:hypothetical protein
MKTRPDSDKVTHEKTSTPQKQEPRVRSPHLQAMLDRHHAKGVPPDGKVTGSYR